MMAMLDGAADDVFQLRVAAIFFTRQELFLYRRRDGFLAIEIAAHLHALHHRVEIGFLAQHVEKDSRRGGGIGRAQLDPAARLRMDRADP